MKRIVMLLGMAALLAVVAGSSGAEGKFKYCGIANCKKCHMSVKQGEQYKKWQETKHSHAIETLSNEKSKEIAKKKGIADPAKAPECLKCHITGGSLTPPAEATFNPATEGVGCEACHGPGSAYYKNQVMKDISAKKLDGATVGLIQPNKECCVKCHNSDSPTMKGKFDFDASVKKVSHPKPKAAPAP